MTLAYLLAYGPLGLLGIGVLLIALRIRADWRDNEQARELLRLIDEHPPAPVYPIEMYRARRRRRDIGGAA